MKLTCKPLMNGIMAYWSGVKDAARYNVLLYINDSVISVRTNERTELYCTFSGLAAIDGTTRNEISSAGTNARGGSFYGYAIAAPQHSGYDYYVQVKAEGRDGKILDVSEKVKSGVREF